MRTHPSPACPPPLLTAMLPHTSLTPVRLPLPSLGSPLPCLDLRKENPDKNIVEELGGKGAVLNVEPLSQANQVLDAFECRSFKWVDYHIDNYKTAEFTVGLSNFYKARTGNTMTKKQHINIYKSMVHERGGALFGGFGYKFTLIDAQGNVVTEHTREI